jgi:hypothetical protein
LDNSSGNLATLLGAIAAGVETGVKKGACLMAKEWTEMSYAELAQELWRREDSLPHLMAKAEMARRAAVQARFNGRCMLASVIIAAVAAVASACSAYFAFVAAAAKVAE